jgi:hypothetical protein
MARNSKFRLSIELLTAVLAIALLAASLMSPDWIEKTLGLAPDSGDGGAEWGLSFAATAVFVVASWLARREWRHARAGRTAADPLRS